MLSDGRLTSGLFQCYGISQDEYVYGIKKIIDVIPIIKEELMTTISNFRNNIEKQNVEINNIKEREELAEKKLQRIKLIFFRKEF